jgi:hypothetical protein
MIKLTALLPRHPSMTHDEFVAYHKDGHAPLLFADPLVRRLVRRYEQGHAVSAQIGGMPQPPVFFDGIAELWFAEVADVEAFYTDDHYFAVIQPDESRFIDLPNAQVLLTKVNPVFGEDAGESDAVEALKRFYAAAEAFVVSGAQDFSIIAETLHEDVVMRQATSLPYGGEWKGHEGVEAWMQAVNGVWSKLEHRDVRIFDAGDDMVSRGRARSSACARRARRSSSRSFTRSRSRTASSSPPSPSTGTPPLCLKSCPTPRSPSAMRRATP